MIKITEDPHSEMLRIEYKDKCVFEGNFTDFSRNSEGFKELFKELDFEVKLEYKDYEEWYE